MPFSRAVTIQSSRDRLKNGPCSAGTKSLGIEVVDITPRSDSRFKRFFPFLSGSSFAGQAWSWCGYFATKLTRHKIIGVNDPLWKRPPRVGDGGGGGSKQAASIRGLPIAYTIASKKGGEMAWVIDTG